MQPLFIIKNTCHCRILQFRFRDHGFDGKRDSRKVEISADDLFTNEFDHLLADGPDFTNLLLVTTDFSSLVMAELVTMIVLTVYKSK